jgi:hypothetical protein
MCDNASYIFPQFLFSTFIQMNVSTGGWGDVLGVTSRHFACESSSLTKQFLLFFYYLKQNRIYHFICLYSNFFQLCFARGFLCEGCHSGEPLFPFQLKEVRQCQDCKSCYHKKCVKTPCSKCVRMKNRWRRNEEDFLALIPPLKNLQTNIAVTQKMR